MFKKITTTTIAAAIALTGMTATPVQANNDDFAKFLVGAAAIFAISQAAKNDRTTSAPRVHKKASDHATPRHPASRKRATYGRIDPLPAQCLARFETSKGRQRYFGKSCLSKSYDDYRRLPQQCETTIWSARGKRDVFVPRCLKQNGFEL